MTRAGRPPYPNNPGYGPGYGPAGGPVPPPPPPVRPKKTVRKVLLTILGIGILLVVAAMIFGRGTAPTRNASDGKTVEKAGTLSAIDLQSGDCYNGKTLPPEPGGTQPISTVEVVPCTAAHTAQVVEKLSYKITDSLSDIQATRSPADCDKAFQGKLQQSVLDDPTFQLGLIEPRDQASWVRHPVVACIVVHPSATTSLLNQP